MKVGILGPTGYTGLELIKCLLRHPKAELCYLGARREERPHIAEIFPALRGAVDLHCEVVTPADPPKGIDLAFVALPHTVAMSFVPSLLAEGIKVIDLSADYRLRDAASYSTYYKVEHADPERLGKAAYGLPELYRQAIVGADLVANPGCYPTAIELALAPLLKADLAVPDEAIIIDAKSGVSGAGRKLSEATHYCECNGSIKAYKVGAHQHTGEILQTLGDVAGREVAICFVPHLVPMERGILTTCYVRLREAKDDAALTQAFADSYEDEPFVRVREGEIPGTRDVCGTNFCDIAVRAVGDHAVVLACIDNLVKGASGQAVQNMNIIAGFDETEGLL